jgi:hypothetical protein
VGTGRDRARFYEYALGSARESRDWYYKARTVLGEPVAQHRIAMLTRIVKLLLTMVPQQRSSLVREPRAVYEIGDPSGTHSAEHLLTRIPMPE